MLVHGGQQTDQPPCPGIEPTSAALPPAFSAWHTAPAAPSGTAPGQHALPYSVAQRSHALRDTGPYCPRPSRRRRQPLPPAAHSGGTNAPPGRMGRSGGGAVRAQAEPCGDGGKQGQQRVAEDCGQTLRDNTTHVRRACFPPKANRRLSATRLRPCNRGHVLPHAGPGTPEAARRYEGGPEAPRGYRASTARSRVCPAAKGQLNCTPSAAQPSKRSRMRTGLGQTRSASPPRGAVMATRP